jgi:eukaryotic-like serine/threonine-protein kinase
MGAARPAIHALLADQRSRWRAGDRVTVEQLIAVHPPLADHPDALLDLIYAEVLLRRAAGEHPAAAEYAARFPAVAAEVRDQFEVDAALPERPTAAPGSTGPYVPVSGPSIPPGYELLEEVGRGGMGVVYKARHLKLDRIIALKMVRSGELADPLERARFASEARAVARLSHPNIVQIYEIGEANGCPFLALEFVPGGTLADALTGPLPLRPSAALVATVARAVHHAHQAGIVHRDLKPANVLLGNDQCPMTSDQQQPAEVGHSARPKVTDFGLAKLLEAAEGPTRTGDFLGTPNYAAPEQAFAAEVVGPPADVHALGGILYHLLAGRPPFAGATALETLDQVRFADPVPPSRLRPNLPRDLETITLKCLRKDQAKRYPSAATLADDLDRFLAGQPIAARPVGLVERGVKWCRRRPAVAGLAAALAVSMVAALVTVTALWRQAAAARDGEQAERERAAARTTDLLLANARLTWLAGDLPKVRAALAECPPEARGPDWRYLERVSAPPVLELDAGEPVRGVAFNRDGTLLAAVSENGRARVWDVATGRRLVECGQLPALGLSVAFSPDGLLVVVGQTGTTGDTRTPGRAVVVTVFDPRTGAERHRWSVPGPSRARVAPGGGAVAIYSQATKSIDVFDPLTGSRRWAVPDAQESVTQFSATGAHLVVESLSKARPLITYDVATGTEVRRSPHPQDARLLDNGVHPDGRRMAFNVTIGEQREPRLQVRIEDPADPERSVLLPRDFWIIRDARFSPDGRWVGTIGAMERTVMVRDAATGAEVLPLRGHVEQVFSFDFSPDGRRIAAAVAGGRIVVWDVRPPGDE